jgi:hypothetical protein
MFFCGIFMLVFFIPVCWCISVLLKLDKIYIRFLQEDLRRI